MRGCLNYTARALAPCCLNYTARALAPLLLASATHLQCASAFTFVSSRGAELAPHPARCPEIPPRNVLRRRALFIPQLRMQQLPEPASGGPGAPDERAEDEGSVVGAALLFAGTAIGAGMLALPAETAPAGFIPSELSLLLCWLFTYTTSLVTLEASWFVGQDRERFPEGAGFLSMSKATLGAGGELATAGLFWFLLTSIIVAYTSGGGKLVAAAVGLGLSPSDGSALFMSFFAALAIFGTERVDLVNRVMVVGMVLSFGKLVGLGLPSVKGDLLLRADYGAIWPSGISVGILSFGAQNVVPTLLAYLGGDPRRTKFAILLGSLIPLLMYSAWEAVFLGNVAFEGEGGAQRMQVLDALGSAAAPQIELVLQVFSACAIASSMAGASVSLVDFFVDALASRELTGATGDTDSATTANVRGLGKRSTAAILALAPPLVLAFAYPDAFLGALENAGNQRACTPCGNLIRGMAAHTLKPRHLARLVGWCVALRTFAGAWGDFLERRTGRSRGNIRRHGEGATVHHGHAGKTPRRHAGTVRHCRRVCRPGAARAVATCEPCPHVMRTVRSKHEQTLPQNTHAGGLGLRGREPSRSEMKDLAAFMRGPRAIYGAACVSSGPASGSRAEALADVRAGDADGMLSDD